MESVDLVYLDPPFKSQQQYNVLFRTVRGEPATAQVRAFTDTWKWDLAAKATYEQLMNDPLVPGNVSEMVRAFHQFLGPSEMLAYLVMMTPRFLELRRVLKPTGSLYLHCDPTASHYLKIVLDTVFGAANFRNEIIWKRKTGRGETNRKSNRFGNSTDTLLFYSKSAHNVFHSQFNFEAEGYDEYTERFYRHVDEQGRRFRIADLSSPKPRPNLMYEYKGYKPPAKGWAISKEKMEQWDREGRLYFPKDPNGRIQRKRFLDELKGKPVQNLWDDIEMISSQSAERLGYPTQKPLALLERIIQASSNPGDLVLDPFCGCGTALVAAEESGRAWIGIDITHLAVDVMARRLRDHFPGISFEIYGRPQDEEGALALAEKNRFEFQVWALSLVDAHPVDQDSKRADRGIDGYLTFLGGKDRYERAIVQVKSGHVGPAVVRDLAGTLKREKAPFALLITLEPPTDGMQKEAAEAGFYEVPSTGEKIPQVQIITVRELLEGKRPKVPTTQVSPVQQAQRIKRKPGERQLPLKDK